MLQQQVRCGIAALETGPFSGQWKPESHQRNESHEANESQDRKESHERNDSYKRNESHGQSVCLN